MMMATCPAQAGLLSRGASVHRPRQCRPVKNLLEEYVPRVYRFALRLTNNPHAAEDLTQETMLRAWRGRWLLRNPQTFRVWLFRITANLWRDQLRRGRLTVARAEQLPLDHAAKIPTPENAA